MLEAKDAWRREDHGEFNQQAVFSPGAWQLLTGGSCTTL